MDEILNLSARTIATRVSRRELSAEAVARAFLARIEACEASVRAWQCLDPDLVLAQARRIDAQPSPGLLQGVPIGVKDLMDTADLPTTYGSPIYAGHRPAADAACVAASRAAGAVVMGKTVTTEFATFQPGPTRNPRAAADLPRTPGGSSSGSAAAVAAQMVPLALGTQTAGSIVRPAAYCGVVGYKPTHGTLPLAGVKALAPSLDTVGVLARSVDDAAFFVGALARLPLTPTQPPALRVGLCQTPHWDRASPDARRALADAARILERAGCRLQDVALPAPCAGLTQAQVDIMSYEAAAAFAPERQTSAQHFSPAFAALLEAGLRVDGSRYFEARAQSDAARRTCESLFEAVDVLLAPSAEGEASAGLASTGDPIFNRLWTLLGNPCVHVPCGSGAQGMPVGVTVVGARWGDARSLAAAHALERSLN